MEYNYCGRSGLQLPKISLGLWHNFGDVDDFSEAKAMLCYAFDQGVTHFDLANNYGPSPGSAEINFGKILASDLKNHRDELIISTKAGYLMWDGPYGSGGSRKYLISSLDQSLKRMGLDYVDIFYSHRYDPFTPLEETIQTLIDIVGSGKALYAGLSNYPREKAIQAYEMMEAQHVHCLIFQGRYSMFVREPETKHFDICKRHGVGFIAFSPLAQGLLTDKYLKGIPDGSRAAKPHGFLQREQVTPEVISKVVRLNELAQQRGQTLAEMALAWTLRSDAVTSTIIGASTMAQLKDNLHALDNQSFSPEELRKIEEILEM